MEKYKTKPCEIEAIQWNGTNLEEIKAFVGESLIYSICDTAWQVGKGRPHVFMKIRTLEGDMEASEGDYIIKGLVGEFYPCKPDVFERKYVQSNVKTNCDAIRNMSDEELAEFLLKVNRTIPNCMFVDCKYGDDLEGRCDNCFLEWLQSEVGEENG